MRVRPLVLVLLLGCAPKSTASKPPADPDRAAMRDVVKRELGSATSCYSVALSEDPTLRGRITFELTVDAAGSVVASRVVESNVSDPRVETCFAEAAATWRFPARTGRPDVPLTFVVVLDGSAGPPAHLPPWTRRSSASGNPVRPAGV